MSFLLGDDDKDGYRLEELRIIKDPNIWNEKNDTNRRHVFINEKLSTNIPQIKICLKKDYL